MKKILALLLLAPVLLLANPEDKEVFPDNSPVELIDARGIPFPGVVKSYDPKLDAYTVVIQGRTTKWPATHVRPPKPPAPAPTVKDVPAAEGEDEFVLTSNPWLLYGGGGAAALAAILLADEANQGDSEGKLSASELAAVQAAAEARGAEQGYRGPQQLFLSGIFTGDPLPLTCPEGLTFIPTLSFGGMNPSLYSGTINAALTPSGCRLDGAGGGTWAQTGPTTIVIDADSWYGGQARVDPQAGTITLRNGRTLRGGSVQAGD